ncbi:MAG: PIG-L family deacetylase, partial [Zoogloea sp.]|nr:PIG-L family deacetylase [Zoogloea sp.]
MNAFQLEPAGMGRILLISPHLDDGVFGCGRLLASAGAATVVTVFAGPPPPGAPLTEWDRSAGFVPGDDVIAARREEDRRALDILGAVPRWLEFSDSQYGPGPQPADVAPQLEAEVAACGPDAVLFPFGLFHSDHAITHQAALLVMREHPE